MINRSGFNRLCAPAARRGNTLVLVSGILALLVIIAAAYISRTQAGRVTAVAEQSSAQRDDNARLIAEMLARIPAEALFAHPVDYNPANGTGDPEVFAGNTAGSNWPRLSPELWNTARYGVDRDAFDNTTGLAVPDGVPDVPYNFAPYHVVPNTNWPDIPPTDPLMVAQYWPGGPGNANATAGSFSPYLDAEGNPLGNPGFGDTRWLRDIEPMRWDWDEDGYNDADRDGLPDRFSLYRHMSYIGTANNAWRLCTDISDVTDVNADPFNLGGVLTDLTLPVEQWMAVRPFAVPPNALDTVYTNAVNFWGYWAWRFGRINTNVEHARSFYDPAFIPPNFYRLKDLNGDGFTVDGERPQDEFVGVSPMWPQGSPRWNVSRVLADADGDGYTDSFWWLAPTPVENGIRQIVAVSIIDNAAMANVNVGTRFLQVDGAANDPPRRTRGLAPTDLALVSQLADSGPAEGPGTWNVGFYDSPVHHYRPYDLETHPAQYLPKHRFDYYPPRWLRHVAETGLDSDFPNIAQRLEYWRRAASRPHSVDPTSGYSQFTAADELELRMYYGQSYPWILSRYEHSVQATSAAEDEDFLRAVEGHQESSEYLDQLPNYALFLDNRRKLTCFNGARNDEMPPWLRWRWPVPSEVQNMGAVAVNNFLAQSTKKVDLRESWDNVFAAGELAMPRRLPYTLMLAFMDSYVDASGLVTGHSYFGDINSGGAGGDPSSALEKMRRFAAGYTANILAWRDEDSDAPLAALPDRPFDRAVPLPEIGGLPEDESTQFLGLEKQPFLTEAFIAHVYSCDEFPLSTPPGANPVYGSGENFVDDSHNKTTIVVVQIANPFDEPIDLSPYRIRVGDKSYSMAGLLYPAREDRPITATYYAIVDEFEHNRLGTVTDFRSNWLDFLDLDPANHPPGTIIQSVLSGGGPSVPTWSTDPDDYYDSINTPSSNNNVIELIRMDNSTGELVDVVVDRFDYESGHTRHNEFKDDVEDMSQPPESGPYNYVAPPDPAPSTKPGIRIGSNLWWVTWTRVTRAWGWDADKSGQSGAAIAIDADEKNPRFIFAEQRVVKPSASDSAATTSEFDGDINDDPGEANNYIGGAFVDISLPETPWITRTYQTAYGDDLTRKPTFFDGFHANDPANPANPTKPLYPLSDWSYPDKGFYNGGKKALQMLLKNGDFETIGELRHVFMSAHELAFVPAGGPGGNAGYTHTRKTFSEFMSDPLLEADQDLSIVINRVTGGPIIGRIANNEPGYSLFHPLHSVPDLPAGLRMWDAFVCDGKGFNWVPADGDTSLGNAAGFTGRPTPGLINLNTAMPEVMHTLPHWNKMVHAIEALNFNPRVALAEAVVQYRERYRGVNDAGSGYEYTILPWYGAPDYRNRGNTRRGDRGLATTGELLLMGVASLNDQITRTGETMRTDAWRIGFGYEDPFGYVDYQGVPIRSARISTDLQDIYDYNTGFRDQPDETAGDIEEYNLLFNGASNLVTTRSDIFTVYFKIRSFRQNPAGPTGLPVWDATDPDYIVDESRWVMQVDRSEVNRPTDKPKILFLEKLPN